MKDQKYTVVIIDDEKNCIANIRHSLKEFPELLLVGTTQSTDTGKKLIVEQQPDLLFLDVEMPEQSGLELLDELQERISWPMQVVFYTAYEKYLLDALRASAFDFLLKPYQESELRLVMNRFFKSATQAQVHNYFHETLAQLLPINESFMIATPTGYQKLGLKQIGYFQHQKDKKQWEAVLTDQTQLPLKRTTTGDDILKYSTSFVQINQHQIINLDYLSFIEGKSCLLLPPFQAMPLEISRKYMKGLQEKFELI
ncbi:response regulator receiver protein [Paludibacter propionicigenes WB4]|uniref:Response regulator receiver protein n=1 Tax=Paludibacter propionicigenes (strain DSM 17365 / JCM 13257 / WB4) TaxID=694427 RepID=E4T787_PALPW|nr:LytTR family DNA-binding domain-containing protein [Paludibacter propionicigenes]ADQ80581.1 response regulator receiver protein [Paludibacter propionicigenes WB4]